MEKSEKMEKEEEKILKELQESQREIADGRGKTLYSLKDLR